MEKKSSPIYSKNTIEFVAVAVEFCTFVENAYQLDPFEFVDKATKLLPLLYLKGALIPQMEIADDIIPETAVTEEMYNAVCSQLATLLGEHDTYLDTFHEDMKYSDSPIAATISETLTDVYQDIGNFVFWFRQENEQAMEEALIVCQDGFRHFWGEQLLKALKALHMVRYDELTGLDTNEEE